MTIVWFVATYVGLALGRWPGLRLDRSGIAILGAVLMLATGRIDLEDARAALDLPTLAVLFGMMLVSVQCETSGLYDLVAEWIVRLGRPRALLVGTVVGVAALSAVLTNDVTCLALTPLIGRAVLRAGLPPIPFLLAIACASNLGSALTPIGNPQNILIAQRLGLRFGPFVAACAIPVVLSLAALVAVLWRDVPRERSSATAPGATAVGARTPDPAQLRKAIVLVAATLIGFLTPAPAALVALAAGGLVLASRRFQSRDRLELVDWPLLMMFVGLFVVVAAFERSGALATLGNAAGEAGLDLPAPAVLLPATLVLSALVSNVPAVMLLLPLLPGATATTGHELALASTFAGNLLPVGSIANLIVVEQAARLGVRVRFLAYVRVGIPVTALSFLAIAASRLLAVG
ncbi:MAG: anion transporter [Planctomycetes bacterium]|nr:anion transporter [Planctomycetota bacterium]